MILEKIAKKNKLSKADIAKDLEISHAYVSMLFQGKRNVSMKLAYKIKNKYNLSFDKIMEEI